MITNQSPSSELPSDQADAVVRLISAKPAEPPTASSWPAINGALLEEKSVAVPLFPLEVLAPSWRSWVDDTARSMNLPADYVAQALLAAVAGLCGGGVRVRVSDVWTMPPWLWVAVVGAPSSGKSPALFPVRQLLMTLEKEGPNAAEPRCSPPRIFGDGKVEDLLRVVYENRRGVIVWRNEAASRFAPVVPEGAVRAFGQFPITLLCALEPEQLSATVHRGEESLAARFLYAWPAPPAYQPLGQRPPADDDAALSLLRAIRNAAGTFESPLSLSLEDGAAAALDGFLAGLHADLHLADGLEAAWLGKGRGLVARLAGVLHLLDWSAAQAADPSVAVGDISRDVVERAITLWSGYYRAHAKALFDRAAPGDLDSRARRVVRWLLACGVDEVSREDVRRTVLGQTVDAREADRVLARLTEGGVVRPIMPEGPLQRGRPALRWKVNPGLGTA